MDPLLRASVWEFLRRMVEEQQVTILLTTHYIHEANYADRVGFMRNGSLLITGPPKQILSHFCDTFQTLNEVFVHICEQKSIDHDFKLEIVRNEENLAREFEVTERSRRTLSLEVMKAVLFEEYIYFKREPM
jgi:ABC-type multidrug transport system ATPase subunit